MSDGRPRIMVVDDDTSMRVTLEAIIEDEGYDVTGADDGYQAIRLAEGSHFDLIFLDMKMPGNGGEVLYHQLKSANALLAHRVIFITGNIVNHGEREFVAATGSPIIEKPFDLNTLQQQLHSLLNDESG